MKINVTKNPGGVLTPASDLDVEKFLKFKNGETYEIDIKLVRSPAFHRKVFAFFGHCFEYWCSDREYLSSSAQFDLFRGNLTVTAGYYEECWTLNGELRLVPKSLSYGDMDQEEFEQFYHAAVNAAMRTIFQGCNESHYNKLMSFF